VIEQKKLKVRRGTFSVLVVSLVLLAAVPLSSAEETGNLTIKAGTISSFDPMNLFKYRPWNAVNYIGFTHVGLVRYDEHLNILPCLAKDWKISDDGRSITFDLVEDARWHDGKPVTADDVKFTFEYNKEHDLSIAYLYKKYYDRVEVNNDHTATLYATEPIGATLLTSLQSAYIIPKHIWENVADPEKYDGKDGMVGCGPFVFQRYDPVAAEAEFGAIRISSWEALRRCCELQILPDHGFDAAGFREGRH
jgi:peptide/nickel transport system substrate-binding protein